jgi:DNA-binding HxlR family transcriptional regulator
MANNTTDPYRQRREPFYMVPKADLAEPGLSLEARCVRVVLRDMAGSKGYCWGSFSTLAERLAVSRSTIKRRLAELVGAGQLVKESRGRGRSCTYRLTKRGQPDTTLQEAEDSKCGQNDPTLENQQGGECGHSDPTSGVKLTPEWGHSDPQNSIPNNSTHNSARDTTKTPKGGKATSADPAPDSALPGPDTPEGTLPAAPAPKRGRRKRTTWPADAVERIYQAYPKHKAKGDALKAIVKALDKIRDRGEVDPVGWLLERVEAYAGGRAEQDPKFTPHPATWFNGERYDDEADPDGAGDDGDGEGPRYGFVRRNPTEDELKQLFGEDYHRGE